MYFKLKETAPQMLDSRLTPAQYAKLSESQQGFYELAYDTPRDSAPRVTNSPVLQQQLAEQLSKKGNEESGK